MLLEAAQRRSGGGREGKTLTPSAAPAAHSNRNERLEDQRGPSSPYNYGAQATCRTCQIARFERAR